MALSLNSFQSKKEKEKKENLTFLFLWTNSFIPIQWRMLWPSLYRFMKVYQKPSTNIYIKLMHDKNFDYLSIALTEVSSLLSTALTEVSNSLTFAYVHTYLSPLNKEKRVFVSQLVPSPSFVHDYCNLVASLFDIICSILIFNI